MFSYNVINSKALIIINSLTSRTRKAEIPSYRATYSSKYISCILNSHVLSDHWLHFLNLQIIQTNVKKHCSHLPINGPSSGLAPITIVAIMTYEESDNKYGSDAGPTVGPSLARVPSSDDKRPPSEGPSRPPLLSIMAALAGLLHMITSTSARAARGRANVSYLPPPLWSSAAARPSAPAGDALSHDTASARANESRGPGKTARSRRVCATERFRGMSRSRLT